MINIFHISFTCLIEAIVMDVFIYIFTEFSFRKNVEYNYNNGKGREGKKLVWYSLGWEFFDD